MTNLSQTDKALSTAAEHVRQARVDVKGKCNTLTDQVNALMGQWGGRGADSFNKLMIEWQNKQEIILRALDRLAEAMVETEKDNLKTDDAVSDVHATMLGRLG